MYLQGSIPLSLSVYIYIYTHTYIYILTNYVFIYIYIFLYIIRLYIYVYVIMHVSIIIYICVCVTGMNGHRCKQVQKIDPQKTSSRFTTREKGDPTVISPSQLVVLSQLNIVECTVLDLIARGMDYIRV